MIQLHNVHKVYETKEGRVHAVDHVTLQIEKGEIYGIIGYSGAGKSTLIRLLNGLEQPTEGKVIVNNYDLTQAKGATLREARQKISMIFQHCNLLWSRTVEENIAFPLEIAKVPKEQRAARVKQLIQLVGLEGREKAYPSQLSGGQKQRLSIARALIRKSNILILDDSTSALDVKTEAALWEALAKEQATMLVVTQKIHTARQADAILLLDEGHVVGFGTHDEMLQTSELYRKIAASQQEVM